MRRLLPLSFPWLVFALVTGLVVWDQLRARDTTLLTPVAAATGSGSDLPYGVGGPVSGPDLSTEASAKTESPPTADPVARDPICGMTVRRAASYRATTGGGTWYFCSEPCRDEFAARPPALSDAGARPAPPPEGTHTMRGLPAWLYQAAVAVVLVLSFGLFELIGRAPAAPGAGMAARWELTAWAPLKRVLRHPFLRFAASAPVVVVFLLIIAAGLFGDQNPAMNIAPLLTWTVWWTGLVFLVLYFGKAWCFVCPWDALATWAERLKAWGPRRDGLGLQLRWPRRLRNIWFAVALFVGLTWIELGLGITLIPAATAWVALGMLALAVVSAFLFERKAFCRYGCLVGRISGLYALFSPVELRTDPTACADCKTLDCYRGNDRGDGCPTFEFPKTMSRNTYCTLCTECVRTCPKGAVAVRLRPWAADLAQDARPRTDEAFLAVILLALTGFHGLTMTPAWTSWNDGAQAALGLGPAAAFTLLMAAMLAAPALVFWALAAAGARWLRPHRPAALFLHYAYALLPIALFYHLAHNAEHFLMEGPRIVSLASDPFGWGWDLFGTAALEIGPLVTLGGLWIIQVLFVLIGHVYGLWISSRITRRLTSDRRAAFLGQLPMLAAMVLFSVFSLWLLHQPMEMRLSGM